MDKSARISIAGHRGLVGSAILRNLQAKGYTNFVLRTHAELDLENQAAVSAFFAAAKVGGIHANNTYPADFIYNNLRPLLTGELEPTNEPYAVAKIAGTDFISVMPTNATGTNGSHVAVEGVGVV